MYNILFFIVCILVLSYTVKYFVGRYVPAIKTGVRDVVLIDRFKAKHNVVEEITREQYAKKIPPQNMERDRTMTHYHINGRSLDKKHLL